MAEQQQTTFSIAADVKEKINHWLQKYPPEQQQSALVPALLLVQEQNEGWLSESAMQAVATYLDLPPIVVYEAASFYDMYNLKPIGRHKISVCTNVSCMLRGSDEILTAIHKRLGIHPGETSDDGQFTLFEVECLAACVGAPMCQIDDREYHEHLTPERMNALIDKLSDQGE